jgi:RIO-like serine/threonine protein kinase
MSKKVIELYEAMVSAGFSRCDTALLHIFVMNNGELKLIDTARAMRGSRKYPEMIIRDFKIIGCCDTFLNHLLLIRPELYKEWIKKNRK